jgi:hypothetical protein
VTGELRFEVVQHGPKWRAMLLRDGEPYTEATEHSAGFAVDEAIRLARLRALEDSGLAAP